jgi:hypothetical protein
LQAKILNHWNEAVSSYDEYNRLKASTKNFALSTAKSISRGLDATDNIIQYVTFIRKKIDVFRLDPSAKTPTAALLRRANLSALIERLGKLPNPLISLKSLDNGQK